MQETQVQSMIQEDPTDQGAMKTMCRVPQLLGPGAATTEAHAPSSLCSATKRSQHNEKPVPCNDE